MTELAAALTTDLVRDEIHKWLGKNRFSVDWVSHADMVLDSFFGTLQESLGSQLMKPLTQAFATSQEYGLAITVGPDETTPTFVRVALTAGRRIVDQVTVDATWWADTEPVDATTGELLRRAAAAATVCMVARRFRPYPAEMHGVHDPQVLFLLNEARQAKQAQRHQFVVKAAQLEPDALAVRFAMLTDALRTSPSQDRTSRATDSMTDVQIARLKAIRLGLKRLADDCATDPYLKVRALYNAGASGSNSMDKSEQAEGHAHFRELKTLLETKEWKKDSRKSDRADILAVVEIAVAVGQLQTCRTKSCPNRPTEAAVIAHATTPRAMYNLACFFCASHPSQPDMALAYLSLALEANPDLAEMVEADYSLHAIRNRQELKTLIKQLQSKPKKVADTKKSSRATKAAGATKAAAAKKAAGAKKSAQRSSTSRTLAR